MPPTAIVMNVRPMTYIVLIYMLKGYLRATQGLQGEFVQLVHSTPPAVSEKQRKSSQNGQVRPFE